MCVLHYRKRQGRGGCFIPRFDLKIIIADFGKCFVYFFSFCKCFVVVVFVLLCYTFCIQTPRFDTDSISHSVAYIISYFAALTCFLSFLSCFVLLLRQVAFSTIFTIGIKL